MASGASEQWVDANTELAEQIASFISARLETRRLTDKLLELTFEPSNGDAAGMTIVASSSEVVFMAGRSVRFELDALPRSETRVWDLVRAIAGGGLTEHISPGRIRFKLRLPDGTEVKGGSIMSLLPRRGARTSTTYAPYKGFER